MNYQNVEITTSFSVVITGPIPPVGQSIETGGIAHGAGPCWRRKNRAPGELQHPEDRDD